MRQRWAKGEGSGNSSPSWVNVAPFLETGNPGGRMVWWGSEELDFVHVRS